MNPRILHYMFIVTWLNVKGRRAKLELNVTLLTHLASKQNTSYFPSTCATLTVPDPAKVK